MRFHPKNKRSKAYYLKVFSPVLLLVIVLCWINFDIIKRSLIDVNARAAYTALLDTKFEINELFFEDSEAERKQLFVKMSPSKYVSFQKERAKKTKDFIIHHYNDTFNFTFYKAKVNLDANFSNADIKLFGQYPDHFGDSDGHSFRLKYDGNAGFGKKKVNVCKPICRSFNLDRMLNTIYSKAFSGLNISSEPIDVIFNKQDYGIYLIEDFLDKYLIEENRQRESFIFEVVDDKIYFNHSPKDEQFITQQTLISELVLAEDRKAFFKQIDEEKLYGFLALVLISNNNHPVLDINLHWYYNPVSNTFEPTVRETKLTELQGNINQDEFYQEMQAIISYRNPIITDWMHWVGKDHFNQGIRKAIRKIKAELDLLNKDAEYLDFRQKLIGFKSKMNKTETSFATNLDKLNLNPSFHPKVSIKIKRITNDTVLSSDLIISKYQHLIVEEGVNISLENNADILILDGQLTIAGTEENPVNIIANSKSQSSIYIQTPLKSSFYKTSFSGLYGLNKGIWQLPSAITLYESNATFTNCNFYNNYASDDMINIFRCDDVIFQNCSFENIVSDAIDSDFSNAKIFECDFNKIGNDGVDGSGSTITIEQCAFSYVEDKAISAGEASTFYSENNTILYSELGLVCKDASVLESHNDSLLLNTLDLVAFIKKPYYSAPTIKIKNTDLTTNMVEKEVKIEGLVDPKYSKNINKKLYGNQFGKASE